VVKELAEQMAGLGIKEYHIKGAIEKAGLSGSSEWSDGDLLSFAKALRETSKPVILAGNRIDLDTKGNYARLKDRYALTAVCAEAELALRQAHNAGMIKYLPGDADFTALKTDIPDKTEKGA